MPVETPVACPSCGLAVSSTLLSCPSCRALIHADALKQLEMGRQAKKTLIVVSDGGDNISKVGFHDVMGQILVGYSASALDQAIRTAQGAKAL